MNKWQLLVASREHVMEKEARVGDTLRRGGTFILDKLLGKANTAGKRFIPRDSSSFKRISNEAVRSIGKAFPGTTKRIGDNWYKQAPRFGGLAGVVTKHPFLAAGGTYLAYDRLSRNPNRQPRRVMRRSGIPQEYRI